MGCERDFAEKERQVCRNLVISRASGVQLARHRSEMRSQSHLDIHVDVFQSGIEGKCAVFDLLGDEIESP